MTKKFVTETGSLYEVDHEGKKIRRLSGLKGPTQRQGQDGEWKTFNQLFTTDDGRLLIDWKGDGKNTLTSPIIRVIKDEN